MVTVQVGAYTVAALAPDGAVVATHRRRFGSRRTDSVDPRTQLARLARNPGAWGNSAVREHAPADLRTRLDTYARDELRAVLHAWATLHGQYGEAVALQALTEAVERGRAVVADATVRAARLGTWGPDRPADPGPDLHVYDAARLPQGVSAC
jgi:nicotinic acid phosphoribosyltransferase